MIESEGYDALAVQCWPSFQDDFQVAPCMAYSLLGSEDGFAVSCEGDVPGAVTMLLMNSMSTVHGSSTLLDLTALDYESDAALLWHCAGDTPTLSEATTGSAGWTTSPSDASRTCATACRAT